jgi:predicted methyltransferase
MNPIQRCAIFHFSDNTTLALEWPKQDSHGVTFVSEALRKAMEAERLAVEVDGNLLVIQMRNVNYVELIPVPEGLPEGAIRGARRAADTSSES